MLFFKNQLKNTEAVTKLLVKNLNAKVTVTTIKQCLTDHPDYPSLLAVDDCLTEWQIANEAIQIDKQKYSTANLDFPFIAHFNVEGGTFVLVHTIAEGKVIYSDEKHQHASISEAEFLEKWDGIKLYAEADEKSAEPNYKNNRLNEILNASKIPFLLFTIIASVISLLCGHVINSPYLLLLLLKLIGVGISTLLLVHSINANNPLVQNLCSLSKKNDCNAILKSDEAKITNWLSWSEVGFLYFTGTFLCLLVNPNQAIVLSAWLSLFALPYIFYSINYQYKNKNWCILCCTVQALLLLENLTTLVFSLLSLNIFNFSPIFLFSTLICFIFPVTVWSLLKPLFLKTTQFEPLKQQLQKFKYNSELFNQVLINQPRYAVTDDLMPVVLGNPQAKTIITMVSNPFCGPCAKAHQLIDEWLQYRDDIQIKIIFATADHDDDERTKVARHVSALNALNNTELLEKALIDWYGYSAGQYNVWAAKYPINFSDNFIYVTKKQKEWCELTEIDFTPTILINGYKLPEPYRLEDMKYLIV